MNWYGAVRVYRPQILDSLRDLHPRCGRRQREHVDGLPRDVQRVAGMHEPGRVLGITDEVRNVVDQRDFRVDDRVHPTDTADPQAADGQLVTDVDGSPLLANLSPGLSMCAE